MALKKKKRIGQNFAPITEGDFLVLARLGTDAPRAAWLLICLRLAAKGRGQACISLTQVAQRARISRNRARLGLADLERVNLIRIASGQGPGRPNQSNLYQILPPPAVNRRSETDLRRVRNRPTAGPKQTYL